MNDLRATQNAYEHTTTVPIVTGVPQQSFDDAPDEDTSTIWAATITTGADQSSGLQSSQRHHQRAMISSMDSQSGLSSTVATVITVQSDSKKVIDGHEYYLGDQHVLDRDTGQWAEAAEKTGYYREFPHHTEADLRSAADLTVRTTDKYNHLAKEHRDQHKQAPMNCAPVNRSRNSGKKAKIKNTTEKNRTKIKKMKQKKKKRRQASKKPLDVTRVELLDQQILIAQTPLQTSSKHKNTAPNSSLPSGVVALFETYETSDNTIPNDAPDEIAGSSVFHSSSAECRFRHVLHELRHLSFKLSDGKAMLSHVHGFVRKHTLYIHQPSLLNSDISSDADTIREFFTGHEELCGSSCCLMHKHIPHPVLVKNELRKSKSRSRYRSKTDTPLHNDNPW